jgi:hypothetical protein
MNYHDTAVNLRTQNNRCTAEPIFVVQELQRTWGMDSHWSDNYAWLCQDEDMQEADDEQFAVLERGELPEGDDIWEKVYYKDSWVAVQAFFTEAAAQDFINRESHNHTELRIYVASASRNLEWQAARFLLGSEKHQQRTHQVCHVMDDIWVGNFESCQGLQGLKFDRIVHIYHPDQPGHCHHTLDHWSRPHYEPGSPHLLIKYLEHSPLDWGTVQSVVDFCRDESQSVLIHCAAGLGRAPTFALIALWARSRVPVSFGMKFIAEAMWGQYRHPHMPMFDGRVLNTLMKELK